MQLTSPPFFSEILILKRGHRTEITWIEREGSRGSNTLLSKTSPHQKHRGDFEDTCRGTFWKGPAVPGGWE